MADLLTFFPDSQLYRSYKSTSPSNKTRYVKVFDAFKASLKNSNVTTIEEYNSKPRMVIHGDKSVDLRLHDDMFEKKFTFEKKLSAWLFDDEDFINVRDGIVTNTGLPISKNQLLKLSRHKNLIPTDQLKQIKDVFNSMPVAADDKKMNEIRNNFLL